MQDTRKFVIDSTGAISASLWDDDQFDDQFDEYSDVEEFTDPDFPRFDAHGKRALWDGWALYGAQAGQTLDEAIVSIRCERGTVQHWLTSRDAAADALRDWHAPGEVYPADWCCAVCPMTGRRVQVFRAEFGREWIEVRTVRRLLADRIGRRGRGA